MNTLAMTIRCGTLAAVVLAMAGCGLAETTVVAADSAAIATQQAKEGKQTLDRVKQQLDQAQQVNAAQRDQAEKDAQ